MNRLATKSDVRKSFACVKEDGFYAVCILQVLVGEQPLGWGLMATWVFRLQCTQQAA